MKGIRWIVGIPIGYYVYIGIMQLNILFVRFAIKFIPSEILWSIESLIVNTFVAMYFGIAFAYFILPRDDFALVNNFKIKVLYFAISLWSVIQLIILGVSVYEAFSDYYSGVIYQILYPILALISMWWMYSIISLIDFRHNQPARDYYEEHIREKEDSNVIDVTI